MSKFKSPHIARWLAGERNPDDVMVFGDSLLSRVLNNPLPFNRKLTERLALNIRFPKGRLESRVIADATREWRELRDEDLRILLRAIKLRQKSTDDSEAAYWFWNTDADTRTDVRTCDLWFDHHMAFSGDDWERFGLPLGQLKVNDICLMYHNGLGIVGVGRVRESWDRKRHRTDKLVYTTCDFPEYRLGIDWYTDIRDNPVDPRSVFGHVPRGFLKPIVKHRKAAIALVGRLDSIDREIVETAEQIRGGSQGLAVSPAVRKAVEDYAMKEAAAYFRKKGYMVSDVSKHESYDLRCKRHEEVLRVEVKGSQTAGDEIWLTPAEVRLARKESPHTALFVLHSVTVLENDGTPEVSGGKSRVLQPWNPNDAMLKPRAYSCKLPPE
jgi:hypothetical protein